MVWNPYEVRAGSSTTQLEGIAFRGAKPIPPPTPQLRKIMFILNGTTAAEAAITQQFN